MRNKIILAIFFLFMPIKAFAVCDATLTVCDSGCDYTYINIAVTDLETNCSSPSEPLSIELGARATTDTGYVTISGISTTSENTLTIFTGAEGSHDGTFGTGYTLQITGNGINIQNSYVIIDGLTIDSTSGAHYRGGIYIGSVGLVGLVFKNMIFKLNDNFSLSGALYTDYWSGTLTAYNNVFYANTTGQGRGINVNYSANLYNNTVSNFSVGINRLGGTMVAKNNISYDNSTDYSGTFDSSSTHNASSDTTAPEYNTWYDSISLTFADAANGDFHLVAGDTDAIDAGEDLGSAYEIDIDGDTRTDPWDLGADEFQGGVTGSTQPTYIIGTIIGSIQ